MGFKSQSNHSKKVGKFSQKPNPSKNQYTDFDQQIQIKKRKKKQDSTRKETYLGLSLTAMVAPPLVGTQEPSKASASDAGTTAEPLDGGAPCNRRTHVPSRGSTGGANPFL